MPNNAPEDPAKDLVYAAFPADSDGDLIFIPKTQAKRLAQIHLAARSATWGEFRSKLPDGVWKEIAEDIYEEEWPLRKGQTAEREDGNEPLADEPLDSDDIPGYEESDWPEWPVQQMLDWVPKLIQQAFGTVEATRISGDYLHLDPTREREIVAAFEQAGYRCTKDEALVLAAINRE